MGIYVIKAYALPGKEDYIKQLMVDVNPTFQPFSEKFDEKILITSEINHPYSLMKLLKDYVSYQWAYNPYSFDEEQGDYLDKISIEFWKELQPPVWKGQQKI